jgi:hypothetical protein
MRVTSLIAMSFALVTKSVYVLHLGYLRWITINRVAQRLTL